MSHSPINQEDQVRAALKALADYDRPRQSQTPALAIYRKRPAQKWNLRTISGAIGLAAAAGVAGMLMRLPQTMPSPHPPAPPQIAVGKSAPVVAEVQPDPPQPVKRVASRETPREVVTDFFPLMDVPPPFERGQLLRVVVPAATMRTVGLPVNPDRLSERVQADVLVGEEGMARAIRFVSYEQ